MKTAVMSTYCVLKLLRSLDIKNVQIAFGYEPDFISISSYNVNKYVEHRMRDRR